MRLRLPAAFVLALAGALSVSCGGIVDPSQNKTDTFSGTVQPAGARAHAFSASNTGEIAIKILTLTPASQPVIGLQWVQGDGTNCNGGFLQVNQFATAGTTAINDRIIAGQYCVIVYDSVGLTLPSNYTLTVSHPE
jgi:hypothetical protein